MKRIAVTLVAMSLSAAAGAADFRFAYSQQDLSTPEGDAQVRAGLSDAARTFCRKNSITPNLVRERHCREGLIEQGARQLDQARLAYRAQTDGRQSG